MANPSSSSISIVNRTSFPLNIALSSVAPFEHTNSLEPGGVWIANSPSFLPFPLPDDAITLPQRAVRALGPVLLSHARWLKRLPIKPNVSIDIRFDHEHNRYTEIEAFHLWSSFSLHWIGLLSLASAFAILTTTQILGTLSPHSSRRIPPSCLVLSLIGAACLIMAFYERRQVTVGRDATLTEGRILSATVPARTLNPIATLPTIPPSPSSAPSSRSHRNFAVLWMRGRFALWDLDLDQEIIAQFNGRR